MENSTLESPIVTTDEAFIDIVSANSSSVDIILPDINNEPCVEPLINNPESSTYESRRMSPELIDTSEVLSTVTSEDEIETSVTNSITDKVMVGTSLGEEQSKITKLEDSKQCIKNVTLASMLSSCKFSIRGEDSSKFNILEYSTPLESISEVTDSEICQQGDMQSTELSKSVNNESPEVTNEKECDTACEADKTTVTIVPNVPESSALESIESNHKALCNTVSSTSSCVNDESLTTDASDSMAYTSDFESKSEDTASGRLEKSESSEWDPLTMYLYEDEESLWEDFGAYLSTLPPRCLSESDSLSFDIPEDLLDNDDQIASQESSSTKRPKQLTRKQWQSCFDLFLNRNRPQLYKVTSNLLFKRQASFADKNSELLKSLQERLLRLRSLSEIDSTVDLSLSQSVESNLDHDKVNH